MEFVVGAVEDRRDPAEVLASATRHEELDLGVFEERVLL